MHLVSHTQMQATGKLYRLRLQVEGTLFCNLQNRARTHAILVIGLYELLGNPTTFVPSSLSHPGLSNGMCRGSLRIYN
jgi:hypothetical protein